MQRRDTPWLIAVLLLIASLAAYHNQQSGAQRNASETTPFTLDIESGAVNNPGQLPVKVLEGPEDQWALLEVDMSGHRRLRVLT